MNRILVGTRLGKPVINWIAVFVVGLIVGSVAGAAGSATWFSLTQEFSLPALVFPIPLAIGYFAGDALRRRFSVPSNQLPALD